MDRKLALHIDDEGSPSSRRARPETTADAHARIGEMLAAKYKLDAIIGSGGMGHVYKATNTLIGRTVAIKMLRREHTFNSFIVDRFLREARTANLVQHPNIVDVIDVGTSDDGVPFIVQEYLEGETLLAYAERMKGKLTIAELSEIMGPVLSAVSEAHDRNIVHRDLKPENVFLAGVRKRRVPKVLDFGISKVRGLDGEVTTAGVLMGTPAYMAPELAVSSRDADPRADVWALGVIVFEMLSGRLPFEGGSVIEVLRAVMTTDARKLSDVAPDVPIAVSRVVERCLAREPDARFSNARDLAGALARAFAQAAPAAVEQWSLQPSGPASSGPVVMPEMPKPAKLPSEANPQTTTVVGSKPSEDRASSSGKSSTLVMDPALTATTPSATSVAVAPSPPVAAPPQALSTSTQPLVRPIAVPAAAPSTPRGETTADPKTTTAKTRKAPKAPRLSKKAIAVIAVLVAILLVEIVIFLRLPD